MKPRETLIALAIENKGDWDKTMSCIQKKKDDYIDKYKDFDFTKVKCITFLDENYPEKLKQSYRPPLVLFYKGAIQRLNDNNIVSIIGTRTPTKDFVDFTVSFVSGLSNDKTIIVNGSLKYGSIGYFAVDTAIKTGKKVIAVLGNGIDYKEGIFEEEIIANHGLIISAFPYDTPYSSENAFARNIVVTALADKVCSISIKKNSGSSFLISQALCFGKDIYCVPNIFDINDYNNTLIDEGAFTLTLSTKI